MITMQCDPQFLCPDIEFIEQMDNPLVRQIDSIVDYDIGISFKHFLLFDINGRPYYCVQTENNISEQVCDLSFYSNISFNSFQCSSERYLKREAMVSP